ncbi:hypothetical protein [Flavobacterium fluviatile]|uniref:hypothetical protein n=1 Tax=Flavobacterium fluviatile TaxID=1862387 RepID=UPI0013D79911|nr:hypothetical protein [Flavobacterium fluviatile]
MSNIQSIIQFLKGKPEHFISITNQNNGNMVGKKDIYISDIPNEDLTSYIKFNLGQISEPTLVWIEMRAKQGVTSIKKNSCKIEVMPDNYSQTMPAVQNLPVVSEPQPQAHPAFLAAPSLGNNIFGLGFPEIMSMQQKANQLEDKKEQLSELKEEYKELKHNFNLLEVSHREALSKLAVAESQKEMAVMIAKNENKSFTDSPAFAMMMEKAPEVLAGIVAMKTGAVPQAPIGLGAPGVSETHDQFIEFINDNLNENQINFLGKICVQMSNQEFQKELTTLIQKYAGN